MSILKKAGILIFLVLFVDQFLKIWVKTHMYMGEEIHILGSWCQLKFIENNGMAYGLELGGEFGKMILSIFRIIAVGLIGWYIYSCAKKGVNTGFIICVSLIFAGALGNIVDSVFYGVVFNNSGYNSTELARLFPAEGGYSTLLHGKVVDMFYFPVIRGELPSWLPGFMADEDGQFEFFRPIFNVADSAITVGVLVLLVFRKKFLVDTSLMKKKKEILDKTPA